MTDRRPDTTEVQRIDLGTVPNIEKTIKDMCATMATVGFHLASTFVFQTQLVLIFQSER